jgi:hypothetical protein
LNVFFFLAEADDDLTEAVASCSCCCWLIAVAALLGLFCIHGIRDWGQARRRARWSKQRTFWKKLWKRKVPAAGTTFDQSQVDAWTARMHYTSHPRPWGKSGRWRAAFRETMSPDEAKVLLGSDSPWSILGLVPGASRAEIKRAWHAMAMKWHPDHNKGDEKQATEQFKRYKAAYWTLTGRA